MPGVDWIPGVSQVKSFFQLVTGDIDGAIRTQGNFAKEFPIVSPVTYVAKIIAGDSEGAKETLLRTVGTINNIANGFPVVGHIKGGVHHVFGDHEGGNQALQAATRSSVVLGTGVVVGLATGGIGAIPAGIAAGSYYDAVDSLISDKPKGVFAAVQAVRDNPNAGTIFDAAACFAADGLAGYSGGKIGNQISLEVARDIKTEQLNAAIGAKEGSVNSMTSGQYAALGDEINALTREINARKPTPQYFDPKTNQMIGSKTTGGCKPITVNVFNVDDGSNRQEDGIEDDFYADVIVTYLTPKQREEKKKKYVQQKPETTLKKSFPRSVTNKNWEELKESVKLGVNQDNPKKNFPTKRRDNLVQQRGCMYKCHRNLDTRERY